MFPQIRQQLQQAHIEDNNIQHRLAIAEKQQAIEDRDNEIQAVEGELERIRPRCVDELDDFDNIWRTGSCLPFGNCKCYYLYFVKCLLLFLFVCSVVALVLSLFCPEGHPV